MSPEWRDAIALVGIFLLAFWFLFTDTPWWPRPRHRRQKR